ncbi:hypothetical protein [Escherichia phage vB-Eco-KMB38]|uniref:Uncharacterized protein n=1 Tax=Escherichia phage PTK TaxID=2809110 RepID=A0A899IN72_9CAUD|nr:hypothetical protein FEPPCPPO_00208 [Escherichia phage PTK]QXV75044.1 hypothetical protein bas47_0039 [Escherichia phage AlbertHofmann]WQN07190.1 hypothetical protein [Escherichia phage vB-Eco-KMB38]HAX4052787.1 hypothetical protein [Escherichia coli]
MQLFLSQTVQLKGIGIPGMISKVLPAFKLGNSTIKEAYTVLWVDGTEDVRMGGELSVIKSLKRG